MLTHSGTDVDSFSAGNNGELYIGVGSSTNAGHPSGIMGSGTQKENYLSAAILVAHMGKPGFNGFLQYDQADDGKPLAPAFGTFLLSCSSHPSSV
jgi:hypothetical protein